MTWSLKRHWLRWLSLVLPQAHLAKVDFRADFSQKGTLNLMVLKETSVRHPRPGKGPHANSEPCPTTLEARSGLVHAAGRACPRVYRPGPMTIGPVHMHAHIHPRVGVADPFSMAMLSRETQTFRQTDDGKWLYAQGEVDYDRQE